VKNNYSTNFYKAYTLWRDALEEDKKYKGYKESLTSEASGKNALSGIVGNKILDLEWLEKIEETLPFMDEAIRESRSFIEQRDEIVPIQKVKKVNTQSIRHLAQHTNMIAKVEANGDVKPDRILNIYYESSYAIYENRFLYTLLGKLHDFVEKRYADLRSRDEKISIKYDINKTVRRKNKFSKMTLEFEYKSQADTRKVDLKADVSHLSGYNRVLRIRRILSDFYTLQLIKDLKGCEPVKPPIIQTNLLSKNVNFRTCVTLWEYVSRYRHNGYIYDNREYTGKMPKKTTNDLSDVFIFANFLTEITFNTDLRRNLEVDYKKEVKLENQIEKEKLKIEKEKRKEATKELVRAAIERKTTPLNKKINSLEEKNARLQFRYEALQYKHSIMVESANDVMRKHKLIEKEEDNIKTLEDTILRMKAQISLKNQSIVNARHDITGLDYPITKEKAEQKIKERREQELKAQVLKFQAKKENEIKAQILKFQEQKKEEIKAQILKFQEQRQEEINSLSKRFQQHQASEDEELEGIEIKINDMVEFPETTEQVFDEQKTEEQKLQELIKQLEKENNEEHDVVQFPEVEVVNVEEVNLEEESEEDKLEELIRQLEELN
jgi:hypothetical protein